MGILTSLRKLLERTLDNPFSQSQAPARTLRVILIRTGEPDFHIASHRIRPLSPTGRIQALEAGEAIKRLLGEGTVAVLVNNEGNFCYQETIQIVAKVLGVQARPSHLSAPPLPFELRYLEKLGADVVAWVSDGSNLARDLRVHSEPGRELELDDLECPLYGTFRELVIEYAPGPLGSYEERARKYV